MRLAITADHLAKLRQLALQSKPNESCAFLLGKADADVQVSEIFYIKNADFTPVSFDVSADDIILAYKTAEQKSLDVVGIFHSHPAPARPSQTDLRYMEINPVVWLIYSTTQDKFAAWLLDGELQQVDIRA